MANAGSYSFPLVKGCMYFDAPGHYSVGHPGCTWNFSSTGSTAFAAMGAGPYFGAQLNDTIFQDGVDPAQ